MNNSKCMLRLKNNVSSNSKTWKSRCDKKSTSKPRSFSIRKYKNFKIDSEYICYNLEEKYILTKAE
jgi:hypothetical protein